MGCMASFEGSQQERPFSPQEQTLWISFIKQVALRALQPMEALYLSEAEQEAYKDAPLTNERYQAWLAWMEAIDEAPSPPFQNTSFVDEGLLVESIKTFTHVMEVLKEQKKKKRPSLNTQERLGLPKILQYIPLEKLTFLSLMIGGKTPQQLEIDLETQGFKMGDTARFMMKSKDFTTEPQQEQISLVHLTVDALFNDGRNHTTDEVYARAKDLGLELCPAELGPHLRLAYKDQPLNEWIYVAMQQIADPGRYSRVFGVGRGGDGLWLFDEWAKPMYGWDPQDEFVLRLRK